MPLTLSTHDTGFEDPDAATIARVLASLDGARNVLATLAHSESSYLQASGSARAGFALACQKGALDRRSRTRSSTLPLAWVTDAFQRYARGDLSWRDGTEWVRDEIRPPAASFFSSWAGFLLALAAVAALVSWLWYR